MTDKPKPNPALAALNLVLGILFIMGLAIGAAWGLGFLGLGVRFTVDAWRGLFG